jgi:hypothetical protein
MVPSAKVKYSPSMPATSCGGTSSRPPSTDAIVNGDFMSPLTWSPLRSSSVMPGNDSANSTWPGSGGAATANAGAGRTPEAGWRSASSPSAMAQVSTAQRAARSSNHILLRSFPTSWGRQSSGG